MKHFITLLFIFIGTVQTHACDCLMYPVENYLDSKYIFTGKVIEILDTIPAPYAYWEKNFPKEYGRKARVEVIMKIRTRVLKTDTLEFTSPIESSNCDAVFRLGESYLFFAHKTPEGKFMMDTCTPWGKLMDSMENVRRLKAEVIRVDRRSNRF